MNPSGGAAHVERLAGQCRFLATALRTQADGYSILRRSDAKFLQAVADQLDAVAVDIARFFHQGDARGVRGRAWWAKRIAGFLVGGAAIVSGVNDALDLLDGDGAHAEAVFNTTINNIASEAYATACVVVDLPDDHLRPSAASRTVTLEGTAAAATSASGDIQLEDATMSGTAETLPPVTGEAHVVEQGDNVGITDEVRVEVEPESVDLEVQDSTHTVTSTEVNLTTDRAEAPSPTVRVDVPEPTPATVTPETVTASADESHPPQVVEVDPANSTEP